MHNEREMISVGIDIGTTTTQIIFSLLTLVDVSHAGQIPRIEITGRKPIHESPITFTPFIDEDTIDAQQLAGILKNEYQAAGIVPTQVETGAVIITGETAKKKNAEQILKAIAGLAGDFVVTVAGPNVESMIAGRGSGAADYSKSHFTTVTNLDIGGGSANSAIFHQGELIAAAAMNFGGRIVIIDQPTGMVKHITEPAQVMLEHLGMRLSPGDRPSLEDMRRLADFMADLAVELLKGSSSPLAQRIYLTPRAADTALDKPVMLSGGIGHIYYEPINIRRLSDVTIFGDIGPLLAESLRENEFIKSLNILRPAETLRATVMGASSRMVTLSGSTIWADRGILPLKNVPVLRPVFAPDRKGEGGLKEAIRLALTRWDLEPGRDHFAISMDTGSDLEYTDLVRIAENLSEFSNTLPARKPFIVIIKHDYAQALGQTIKAGSGERPLLIIDQVGLEEGDYIDIGVPLMDGRVVPLIVKTLIFHSGIGGTSV